MTYEEALRIADEAVQQADYDVPAVPKPLRTVYLVGQLEFEMTVGGVHQWLVNTVGKYAVDTVEALEEIGAHNCARIVRRILASLPDSPSPDDVIRAKQVEQVLPVAQAAWRELVDDLLAWPDDVDRLLRMQPSAIVRAARAADRRAGVHAAARAA